MNVKNGVLGLLDAIVKITFIIVIVLLILRYSKLAYNYGYHIFNQTPVSSGAGRTVTVTISEGESARSIASKLAEAGLITDKRLFLLQEKFSDYNGLEKPGTYELSTAMTPEEMIITMAGGKDAIEKKDEKDNIPEIVEESPVEDAVQPAEDVEAVAGEAEGEEGAEGEVAPEEENGD